MWVETEPLFSSVVALLYVTAAQGSRGSCHHIRGLCPWGREGTDSPQLSWLLVLGLVSSVSSLSQSARVSVLLCLFSQFFLWSLQKLFAPCARFWLGLREALSVGLQIVFRSCIIHCPGISGELSTVETSRSEALKPELGKSLVGAVVEGT